MTCLSKKTTLRKAQVSRSVKKHQFQGILNTVFPLPRLACPDFGQNSPFTGSEFKGSRVKRFRVYRKFEPLIREFCLPARQACEAGGNGEGMKIEP